MFWTPDKDEAMKSYTKVLVWFLAILFVSAFGLAVTANAAESGSSPQTAALEPNVVKTPPVQAPDSVAVTVNGVDITESQVEEQIKPLIERLSPQAEQLPPSFIEQYKSQVRKQILERMIVEHLLDEKVKDANIVVTEEEVINQLEEMTSEQDLSLEDLKVLVEARGQSFDETKQRVRRGMGYQKLIEGQWGDKIKVTEDEAQKYYSENKSDFEIPEQVRASHILITPDTSDPNNDPNQAKTEARAKAESLLKQIRQGADFAELARANSSCSSAAKGGDLNYFSRGQMVPAFEKVAFELKPGQFSDIVETQFGYHIIKVADHRDPNTMTFEQAKDDIIKGLTQQKQAEFVKQYVESLKAQANIVYPAGKNVSDKENSSELEQ